MIPHRSSVVFTICGMAAQIERHGVQELAGVGAGLRRDGTPGARRRGRPTTSWSRLVHLRYRLG
jgi:hypothetical protein